MAMGHAVACGLSLNELCQMTFTPLLKSDSYYCADPYALIVTAKRTASLQLVRQCRKIVASAMARFAGTLASSSSHQSGSRNSRTTPAHKVNP